MRRFSAVAFGHRYRLELIAALGFAGVNQGICLTLLGDCCEVKPSVYHPPIKAMQGEGMVMSTGRGRPDRRVLYARTAIPFWTALQRMAEDLAVDVDLGIAALEWSAVS
jgi:hypothetical protein